MGRYDGYWEMRERAGTRGPVEEVYKCTDCGSISRPDDGHSGAPDPHSCKDGCRNRFSVEVGHVAPVGKSEAYRKNFDRIFPNAPGAGV